MSQRSPFGLAAPLVAGLGLALSLATAARAATPPFSTEPPAVYRQAIEPLLTPAAAALEGATSAESRRREGTIGSVLLDETIYWVAENGAVYRTEHQIYRADSEAAIEEVARNVTHFESHRQKIHLVLARTLPPGGSWQTVRPETVFVQSPQDQAELSIYSDTAELVVVFPQIRTGSVTEQIVLIEEPVFSIPGQLTAMLAFNPGWPTDLARYLVELPAAMAARLADTPIGAAPEPRRGAVAGGRQIIEWKMTNPPVVDDEPGMAPVSERGPAVFLTTLRGWDEFADWFRGLLAGRDLLPPDLQAAARGWTAEAKSPEEIVRILHRRVTDDIRYTGLEFGLAGYRPKTAAEVWSDGYGDCKDKANLLRALLADQGIASSLALLDTYHAGTIETRSPDFRHFNHAILAIEMGGGLSWADPTLSGLDPGQLGPNDGERQALLIPAGGGWRFVTTPPAAPPRLAATAELEMAADGALQGALTIEADLFYAGLHKDFLLGDEAGRLRAAENLAGEYFAGAEVIDLEVEETSRGLFRAKVYFAVPGEEEPRLAFSDGGWLARELEQEGSRRTTYFQARDRVDLAFRFRLPPGLAPGRLPAPLAVDLPSLAAQAGWRCEPGECRLELRQEQLRGRIEPADFPAFLQAKQAIDSWLSRPPRLEPDAGGGQPPRTAAASDLPLMPTGAGQLRLLDHKYPEGVQDDRRRAGLEQVLQFFPTDRGVQFEAQMKLGTLDCEEGGAGEGARRMREGLARHGDAVSVRLRAWGRYLLAICDGVPREEAIGLLRANADDPAVDEVRRGWSLLSWVDLVAKEDPQEAMALVDRVLALPEALAADGHLAGLAFSSKTRLLAKRGDPGLAAALATALESEHAAQVAGYLAGGVELLAEQGEAEAAGRLADALEPALEGRPALAPVLEELRGQQAARARAPQLAAIARELEALFADSPPSWWASQPVELGDELAAVKARLEKLGSEEPIPPFVRQAFHFLTRFPPEDDFSQRLYQVAWSFANHFKDAAQTEPLLGLLRKLPTSDVYHWEGEVLTGQRLSAAGDLAGAAAFYRRQLADGELPEAFRSVMKALLADVQLAAGELDEARRLYRELAEEGDLDLPLVAGALLTGTLLELEAGRPEEAWPLLRRLREAEADVLANSSSPLQAGSLAKLAADEAAATAAWATTEAWWPRWLELEKKAGLLPAGRPISPVLGDMGSLGQQMRASQRRGDTAGAYGALRRLAHAARWDPAVGLELAIAFTMLAGGSGNLAPDMAETAVQLLSALPPFPQPDNASRADLLLGAFLLDLKKPEEVFAPVRRLLARTPKGQLAQRGAMLQAAAAAATGDSREEAAGTLAAALDDSFPRETRAMAVDFLAQLYRQLGRREDERLLLEREVVHPAIAGTELGKKLESRLEASRHGGDADVFAQVFAEWAAKFELPFLAWAEPASLDDPRLAGKKETELLAGDWLEAEKVKIAFLAAADGEIPVADRSRILGDGLDALGNSLARQSTYRRMLQAMVGEPRFPVQVRIVAEFMLAMSLVQSENLPELDRLLASATLIVPRQREFLAAARETVELRTREAPEIEKFLEARLAAPLTEHQATFFPELWRILVLQGDPAALGRLDPKLDGLAITGGDPGEVEELRLTVKRLGSDLREQRAAAAAMRELLAAELKAVKKDGRPAALDEVANLAVLASLPPAACRELLLFDLATNKLGAIGTLAWPITFVGCLEREHEKLRRDLVLAFISALERDETRAEALGMLPAAIGFDEPLWTELLAELKRRMGASDKKSLQALRGLELQQAVRRGEKVDFEAEATGLSGDSLRNLRLLQADLLLHDRDAGGARAFLAASSPAELKHAFGMAGRLELLRLLPAAPERQLVESAARRQLYEARLKALMHASWIPGVTVLRLAARLDGQGSYPAAWLDSLLAAVDNEYGRSWLRLYDAELRQDWAAAYAAAARAIELGDIDHDNQWHLGRAAFELGKQEEARRALTLFRERSKGHPRQSDAAELLARLAGGS
jgi:transglutaminase-like putative cysteine protease